MSYDEKWREAELIAKVKKDFFNNDEFDTTEYIGNIDFSVVQKPNLFTMSQDENPNKPKQALFWAEAKRGKSDNIKSIIQLILTIGRAKTHEKYLPPEFIGAFNATQIAFVPFEEIAGVFNQNDFNFSVAANDYNTKEFKQLYSSLDEILKKRSLVFDFFDEKDSFNTQLQRFIKNLGIKHGSAVKIGITTSNFAKQPYFEWLQFVKPTINADFEKPLERDIFTPSHNEFYLADLFADENSNETLEKAGLRLILKKDHYILKVDESGKRNITFYFDDEGKKHKAFWKNYQRPPLKQYQQNILKQRHLLAPQDKKEYQGAFFTPRIWVLKAKEYLESVLGKGFEKEYVIWDCAAGTGNLLEFFDEKAKANIYASTLDEADVKIMRQRVENEKHFPLFERHIFQFDFLNDDFSKLPENLQDILKDEKKREKLIIFINPPYAEATSATTPAGTGQNKALVARGNKVSQNYKDILGKANNELFAQFFMRIYKEIPNCILASFSTLKYVNSANFAEFRQTFKAEFKKGFICPADTFDNVKGQFPIGFLIWNLNSQKKFTKIQLDIFERNGEFVGKKGFYVNLNSQTINQWIKKFDDLSNEPKALMDTVGTDLQHSRYVKIVSPNFNIVSHSIELHLTQNNIIPMSIYFAVRHAIDATWLNDRDQFLYPNDKWIKDIEFQNDCLAFTLFHSQNRISSKMQNSSNFTSNTPPQTPPARGGALNKANQKSPSLAEGDLGGGSLNSGLSNNINHFIPFNESEVNAKEAFKSGFMFEFINGKLGKDKLSCHIERSEISQKRDSSLATQAQNDKDIKSYKTSDNLFGDEFKQKNFIPQKPLKFSKEARAVFDAGREIWLYYHTNARENDYNANASLYDIKEYFQGRKKDEKGNETGRMNATSTDERYNELMANLRLALKNLGEKITPKIYEYGFLRK